MEPEQIPSSSQNPITGDHIITKASSKAYRNGYDRIFGKKKEQNPPNIDLNVESSDLNVGSKEDSLDAPEQSNLSSECSQQPKEAEN